MNRRRIRSENGDGVDGRFDSEGGHLQRREESLVFRTSNFWSRRSSVSSIFHRFPRSISSCSLRLVVLIGRTVESSWRPTSGDISATSQNQKSTRKVSSRRENRKRNCSLLLFKNRRAKRKSIRSFGKERFLAPKKLWFARRKFCSSPGCRHAPIENRRTNQRRNDFHRRSFSVQQLSLRFSSISLDFEHRRTSFQIEDPQSKRRDASSSKQPVCPTDFAYLFLRLEIKTRFDSFLSNFSRQGKFGIFVLWKSFRISFLWRSTAID